MTTSGRDPHDQDQELRDTGDATGKPDGAGELDAPGTHDAPATPGTPARTDQAGEPEVYSLHRQDSEWEIDRRSFLAAAGAAASVGIPDPSRSAEISQEAIQFAHTDLVLALAVTPDGRLISGSADEKIKFWTLPDGSLIGEASEHGEAVRALAVSPDGRVFASGSEDRSVRIWSLSTDQTVETLDDHTGAVQALTFSSDGQLLASGGSDGHVRLWNVPAGDVTSVEAAADLNVGGTVFGVAIDPGLRYLFAGDDRGRVSRWALPNPQGAPETLQAHSEPIRSVAVSPDGEILATGGGDGVVRLWSIPSMESFATLRGHDDTVRSLAFSPDGSLLASGSWDDTIKIWRMPAGTLVRNLTGHAGDVNALAVTADGQYLASGSDDKSIRIWSLESGEQTLALVDLEASPQDVEGIRYSTTNTQGQTVTYTLPCGSPIPAGATCVCNCVPGSWGAPQPTTPRTQPRTTTTTRHYWYPN